MSQLQNNAERALVVCSLWLHSGFIGASALVVGLLQLLDGESKGQWALGLAFFGGALAAACWRRGLTALDHADRVSAVAADAPTESASRALSKQAGRGAIAMLSPIPLQSKRRPSGDFRRPTPE